MGRSVQGHKPGTTIQFVPNAFGNDKDPEPMVVLLTAPSEGDKREVDGNYPLEVLRDANGEVLKHPDGRVQTKEDPTKARAWQRLLLEKFVREVRRYEIGGQPITNAAELLQYGESEVLIEVYAEIMRMLYLSDAAAKPFAGSSDSSPPTNPASSGSAASAGDADSKINGIVVSPTATLSSGIEAQVSY